MGLTLPSELTEPLGWVGLTWSEADEELLFESGRQWITYGEELARVAESADAAAGRVWQAGAGEALDAFRAWWAGEDGPQRRLGEDAAAALLIGAALVAFAAITLALKIAFIVQLILLAIEVAQAIATAFVTFGATTAEIPGFIAATRLICRRLIQQVIEHVTTVIKDLLLKAKDLLKVVTSRRGGKVASDAVRQATGIRGVSGPMTVRRFEGKPMLDAYRYETDPAHLSNPFRKNPPPKNQVLRLTPEQREAHRVVFDGNGLLRNASDGSLFDTSEAVSAHTTSGGRAIFVMDEQGNIYASKFQDVGRFHHSTLSGGDPVAAAGEISVVDGRLDHVTSASGHYRPGVAEMQQFASEVARNGAGNPPFYAFDGRTSLF